MPTTAAPSSDKQVPAPLHPPVFLEKSGRQSPRPNLSSSKPSWIGPPSISRPDTPGIATMPQKVKIHYSHPGLQPPVFVAGSVCEPEWHPIEMEYTEKDDGELHFWLEFDVEPGEYQYKFRLGPGDWWALDDTKPIVDDGTGNRNHILKVEPASSRNHDNAPTSAPVHISEKTYNDNDVDAPNSEVAAPSDLDQSQQDTKEDEKKEDDVPESEQLLRHETTQQEIGVSIPKQETVDEANEAIDDDYTDDEEPPLLDHEAGPEKRVDSKRQSPSIEDPAEFEVEADDELDAVDDDYDDGDAEVGCPLFRHETMSATDADPDEAPLFRHESMSPIDSHSVISGSPTSPKRHQFTSEDIDDPSLVPFPTDEAGILARLQRTETRLPEDETMVEGTPPSPSLSQTKSFSPVVAPVSLIIETADVSQRNLDAIDETDETDDDEPSQPIDKEDSTIAAVPIDIQIQDVSEIPEDRFSSAPDQDASNRGPPTPPMTPDEHHQVKVISHDGSADTVEISQTGTKPIGTSSTRETNATDHVTSRSVDSKKSVDSESPERSLALNFWSWFAGLCGGPGRATGVAIAMGVAAAAFAVNTRST